MLASTSASIPFGSWGGVEELVEAAVVRRLVVDVPGDLVSRSEGDSYALGPLGLLGFDLAATCRELTGAGADDQDDADGTEPQQLESRPDLSLVSRSESFESQPVELG
jgi:hypothetical protein